MPIGVRPEYGIGGPPKGSTTNRSIRPAEAGSRIQNGGIHRGTFGQDLLQRYSLGRSATICAHFIHRKPDESGRAAGTHRQRTEVEGRPGRALTRLPDLVRCRSGRRTNTSEAKGGAARSLFTTRDQRSVWAGVRHTASGDRPSEGAQLIQRTESRNARLLPGVYPRRSAAGHCGDPPRTCAFPPQSLKCTCWRMNLCVKLVCARPINNDIP
jgi:hypothetical protein